MNMDSSHGGIPLKIFHSGDVRRARVPGNATYADLVAALHQVFGVEGVIQWKDDEDDFVNVKTDNDWHELLRTNDASSAVVRLHFTTPTPAAKPNQQQQQPATTTPTPAPPASEAKDAAAKDSAPVPLNDMMRNAFEGLRGIVPGIETAALHAMATGGLNLSSMPAVELAAQQAAQQFYENLHKSAATATTATTATPAAAKEPEPEKAKNAAAPKIAATQDAALHPYVACDGCESQVVGSRFKCLECPDFDLCGTCEAAGLHSSHLLVRMRNPSDGRQSHLVASLMSTAGEPQDGGRRGHCGRRGPRGGGWRGGCPFRGGQQQQQQHVAAGNILPASGASRGCYGPGVVQIQHALISIGAMDASAIRFRAGFYGPNTERSVFEFAARENLDNGGNSAGVFTDPVRDLILRELATLADVDVQEQATPTAPTAPVGTEASKLPEVPVEVPVVVEVPAPTEDELKWSQEIQMLGDMGFTNTTEMTRLLVLHQGNLQFVIAGLL